jgi:hypothetical protein
MKRTLHRDSFAQRVWEDDGGARYGADEARHPRGPSQHDRFAEEGAEVNHTHRFATVITHTGARDVSAACAVYPRNQKEPSERPVSAAFEEAVKRNLAASGSRRL